MVNSWRVNCSPCLSLPETRKSGINYRRFQRSLASQEPRHAQPQAFWSSCAHKSEPATNISQVDSFRSQTCHIGSCTRSVRRLESHLLRASRIEQARPPKLNKESITSL